MGKHKIIKSAAAVALTASVVATAAAPGASAASYKTNAKDQLVHTSTGKLVKGWKVFGGKLYKNGKLAPAKKYKIIGTGAAQKLFYGPTLKKGYKTANSKTLLFKDGKLADGWKQAGKNERLYKNGKLDKGYTVYTNVEGDKFLYQNGKLKKGQKTATRGGETLLFVDGKLAKGYVLHEASKTLFNNGKVAEGLVKYPETDGKFYNDGKLANGEINGAEYKDGVLVAKDIASVKAINGTTVEVTFKEAQKADDVKAADYKIEGLEVKNAAVKQTDSKVVVLTTSAQEAAKEYTLVYKEADTKTFTGVSAVIPTSVKITKGSQQGVIGKEVTVEAQVTVAEGQSKAGIPVTIVVDSNSDTNAGGSNNVASDKKVEVYTDENGVAKYSYTQYADDSIDTVNAYPTGDASVKSVTGKVYWGQAQRLSLEKVTEGASFANQAKVVYKVKVTDKVLLEKAKEGRSDAYVNVAFKENVDVTPDKVVTGVKVVDANTLSNSSAYPYQVTTGGKQYVQVKLDKDGEATFTLQGTEATATPIVFADGTNATTKDDKLAATELQATAPAATFAKAFSNELEITSEGQVENSASIKTGVANVNAAADQDKLGGRTYTVTVKGKDGKTVSANTPVKVAFKKGDFSTDKAVYVYDAASQEYKAITANNAVATVYTNDKGQAAVKVIGIKDGFAKPTVFFDNGQGLEDNGTGSATGNGKLDAADLQQTATSTTYFVDEIVKAATLTTPVDTTKTIRADKDVEFTYTAKDQNGNTYVTAEHFVTSFQVTATTGDVKVTLGKGQNLKVVNTTNNTTTAVPATGDTVAAGQTKTYQVTSTSKSDSSIVVKAVKENLDTLVNVEASASQVSLPNQANHVTFTKIVNEETAALATINDTKGDTTVSTYTKAGITGVTSANLDEVAAVVAIAINKKGSALTKAEVQAEVNKVTTLDTAQAKITALNHTTAASITTAAQLVAAKSELEAAETAIADAKAAGATDAQIAALTNYADVAAQKAAIKAVTEVTVATAQELKAAVATNSLAKLVTLTTAIDLNNTDVTVAKQGVTIDGGNKAITNTTHGFVVTAADVTLEKLNVTATNTSVYVQSQNTIVKNSTFSGGGINAAADTTIAGNTFTAMSVGVLYVDAANGGKVLYTANKAQAEKVFAENTFTALTNKASGTWFKLTSGSTDVVGTESIAVGGYTDTAKKYIINKSGASVEVTNATVQTPLVD